jgi:UDP-N-acetylglucosamine:LPS N-acetylglucosamine transferase
MDKTTLFVSGMSMGDEHINKIIENALSINTFHLVIFCADSNLITELKEKYKSLHNVIIYDDVCYFSGLADILNNLQ